MRCAVIFGSRIYTTSGDIRGQVFERLFIAGRETLSGLVLCQGYSAAIYATSVESLHQISQTHHPYRDSNFWILFVGNCRIAAAFVDE
jgi:hypothetical protein